MADRVDPAVHAAQSPPGFLRSLRGPDLRHGRVPCDIRRMVHDRLVQPRQIYASTITRRERRWTRRRGRSPLGLALVSGATLLVALSLLAIVVPGVA